MSALRAWPHKAAPRGLAAGMTVPGKSIHSFPLRISFEMVLGWISLEESTFDSGLKGSPLGSAEKGKGRITK